MKTLEAVLLELSGMFPHQIIYMLGLDGYRFDRHELPMCRSCPIARFLQKETGIDDLSVGFGRIFRWNDPKFEGPETPQSLKQALHSIHRGVLDE